VSLRELTRDRIGATRIAPGGAVNGAQKGIGHTVQRGGDNDAPLLRRLDQQRADMPYRAGVSERGAAELVDGDRMCDWRHRPHQATYGNWYCSYN
jgi:hypothetical protein